MGMKIDTAITTLQVDVSRKEAKDLVKDLEKIDTANKKKSETDSVSINQKSVALAAATTTNLIVATEKTKESKAQSLSDMLVSRQSELSSVVKDLQKSKMKSGEVSDAIVSANRQVNASIAGELKQAYYDYSKKNIKRDEFENRMYGIAIKKLDSIVSALRDALAQKVAPADENREKVKEKANETKSDNATKVTSETRVTNADDAAKANAEKNTEKTKEAANETKSDKANKETRVTDAVSAAKANAKKSAEKTKEKANETAEKIPPGLEKKEEVKTENGNIVKAEKEAAKVAKDTAKNAAKANKEAAKVNGNSGSSNGIFGSGPKPINGNGNEGNAFGQMVNFFNNIDKMINAFADEAEGKGNDEDKSNSLLNFASRLSDSFSGINKTFGKQSREETLGHKLGMTQMNKETISQLFNNGHGSGGAINRISDAGEGSGNFNAVSFMSSISNGINDALENYKDIQKAEKEVKEEAKEEAKEAVGVLA